MPIDKIPPEAYKTSILESYLKGEGIELTEEEDKEMFREHMRRVGHLIDKYRDMICRGYELARTKFIGYYS